MSSTDTTTTTDSTFDAPLGSGSIAIIVMIGISFIICLLSRGTTSPLLISFIGAMLPVLVFVILYLYPKETSTTDKTQDSRICCDTQYRARIIILVVVLVGAFLAFYQIFKFNVFNSHYARKAPSGFQQKRQEEFNKQKQLLKLVKEQGDDGDDQNQLLNNQQQDNDFSKNSGPNFPEINANQQRFGNQKKIL